ncbi:hypothetical protein D5085_17155 [Ectothiorhodospiraceae bacterium BW-2]|nr:hypothetical protein D5085_17155 [Ectothiorhodospiraceae bacterium BW-2]
MAYGNFATYEEVALKFKIKFREESFIKQKPLVVDSALYQFIHDNLTTKRSYISENAICEAIIYPILSIVAKHHQLPLWSHIRLDISEEEGLMGVPDFIIAPASDIGTTFRNPIVCIAEAKRDNFNEGWAQVLAEMIAAQKMNQDPSLGIFGIVTTGNFWQFAKLEENIFTMEIISYSASEDLQQLFDLLNWLIMVAKKIIL